MSASSAGRCLDDQESDRRVSKPAAEDAIKKSHDIYLNQLMALEDAQEGLRALLEKRKPSWKNK